MKRFHLSAPHLLAVAALLILVFAVRAHAITALPAFNDESLHIRRSEVVWSFTRPDISFTAGKLLGYYWLGAFGFDRLDALHGGRLVYALFILIGAAATYRVGRTLFTPAVGLLALLLYAVAPYLVFYERLILADQLAASFGMLAIWAGIRLARHPTRLNGLLSGGFVSLAILAKLTAAPFALVSLLAIWTLGEKDRHLNRREKLSLNFSAVMRLIPPRRYWPALLAAYTVNGISGLPFILFPIFRQVQEEPVLLVSGNLIATGGPHEVIAANLDSLLHMLSGFFGWPAVLVALIAIGRLLARRNRAARYLTLCTLLPWAVIVLIASEPSNRYWLLGMPPLLVLVAAGIWNAASLIRRRGVSPYAPTVGLILLWIIVFAAPFIRHAWTDPLKLRLPDHDRWEYFTNFSSGYGLNDAAAVLPTLPPSMTSGRVPVVSTAVGCHALRLLLPEEGIVNLKCPFFGWQGEHMDAVIQEIDRFRASESVVYLLVEPDAPFARLDQIPYTCNPVQRFERPFDGVAVEVCRILED